MDVKKEKRILNVETCYGQLELEHWESIYMLFLNQFLVDYMIDNSADVKISSAAMIEGFVSFYKKTPRMLGEYTEGKGKYSFYWRWNQSRGQVVVKLPLHFDNEKKMYYVKILKFNHRILHHKNILCSRIPRSQSIYKAWILEIYSATTEYQFSFYWCQNGKKPETPIDTDILSFDRVIEIIDSVPDIDWEQYEMELMRGCVDTDKSNVAVYWQP